MGLEHQGIQLTEECTRLEHKGGVLTSEQVRSQEERTSLSAKRIARNDEDGHFINTPQAHETRAI